MPSLSGMQTRVTDWNRYLSGSRVGCLTIWWGAKILAVAPSADEDAGVLTPTLRRRTWRFVQKKSKRSTNNILQHMLSDARCPGDDSVHLASSWFDVGGSQEEKRKHPSKHHSLHHLARLGLGTRHGCGMGVRWVKWVMGGPQGRFPWTPLQHSAWMSSI